MLSQACTPLIDGEEGAEVVSSLLTVLGPPFNWGRSAGMPRGPEPHLS